MTTLSIPIPTCANQYYQYCGKIDQCNYLHCDGLKMEQKLETKDWSKQVNFMALGMTFVDSYLAHRGCTMQQEIFNKFIHKLADEFLECDLTTHHQRSATLWGGFESPKPKRSTNVIHLTPQKKLRPHPTTPTGCENNGQAHLQIWCQVCGKCKSAWLCSR